VRIFVYLRGRTDDLLSGHNCEPDENEKKHQLA